MRSLSFLLAVLATVLLIGPVQGQDIESQGKAYPDGHGGEVFFPMGDISFADEVVEYTIGDPDGGAFSERPEAMLGPPQFETEGARTVFTLGCGGSIVLAFTTNTLVNVSGPDLHVFEVGRDIESVGVAVSEDGETWTRVGVASGGNAEVDISPFTPSGTHYRYVKLVDLEEVCEGNTPGADLDSVGAIGAAARVEIDSAVLFDTDEHTLKAEASHALDDALSRIPDLTQIQVEVAGHTDNVGSADYNETLSGQRAETVAAYLVQQSALTDGAVTTRAYGETQPVASNETEEGRQQNRRVELNVRSVHSNVEPAELSESSVTRRVLGVWDTSGHGILELQQQISDGVVQGTYRGGTLQGIFSSNTVLEGTWIQDDGDRECTTEKNGSWHWGTIRLEFESEDQNRFTGTYSYCNNDAEAGIWRGRRMM